MDFFAPSWPIIVTTVVGATLLSSKLMKKLSSSRKENQNNGAKLPPTATSFLPFVGKAIEMGIDIKGFVSTYCSKLGSSIFRATIAGNSCYFLGNSKDITWIFHSNKLEFKYLHVDFLANAAGMDRKTALRLYDHPNLLPNLVKGTNRFIFNTEALQETIHTAQVTIDKFLDDYEGISNYQYTAVNLLDLVREIIFMASVTPFVSPEMATKENLELFQEFDNGVPMAVAGVPIWCMPKFRDVRAKLLGKLLAMQTESKLLASRRQAFKEAGFNDRANASSNLSIFWAVNGNSIPMVFWGLAHVLSDSKAHAAIQEEVSKHKSPLTLDDMDQMPVLTSIFWETCRLAFGGFNPRHVKEDFVHNGRLLEKGTRIMAFTPMIHYDPNEFENPNEFQYDRFLNRTKPGVYVFGGGAHMCPGRKFIQYEFKGLLCLLLQKLDMRVAHNQTLPGVRPEMEGVGVSQPKEAFFVELQKKK